MAFYYRFISLRTRLSTIYFALHDRIQVAENETVIPGNRERFLAEFPIGSGSHGEIQSAVVA